MSTIVTEVRYTEAEAAFLKNIGFRIQYFRRKIDMSQEQLAELSGLSYSTVSHIESTAPYPLSLLSLYRIASALQVEPHQLLQFE